MLNIKLLEKLNVLLLMYYFGSNYRLGFKKCHYITMATIKFHPHGYVNGPSDWTYPDVARFDSRVECVRYNGILIRISFKYLKLHQ